MCRIVRIQSNEALQAELHSNLNRDNSLKLNIWTKFPDMNLKSGLSLDKIDK